LNKEKASIYRVQKISDERVSEIACAGEQNVLNQCVQRLEKPGHVVSGAC